MQQNKGKIMVQRKCMEQDTGVNSKQKNKFKSKIYSKP